MSRSSIGCPDLHRLQEMLAGTLPEQEQSALTSHLDTCATCRQTLEDLATDGESWSDMMSRLKNKSAAIEPALEQAMVQIKAADLGTKEATPSDSKDLDFLSPPRQQGQIGRLAHYEISEVIGQGGMGIVLKGFDSILHRIVAIKVLPAASPAARKRFLREARAAAKITHDHVVTIHAVDEAPPTPSPLGAGGGVRGIPYLVMQYIDGVSLQQWLDQGKPLNVEEIVRIGYQIACGLATAHAHGLVHRDIKPANILLERDTERVKITDFGLARAVDDASLTQSGVVAGTPLFMAPEQARGQPVDHRADLFSLGSVLYMMCTGRPPFRAETSLAVLRRVSEDTPKAIKELNPAIPDWLVAVIGKLHAKNPAQRYQSAAEVAEIFKKWLYRVPDLARVFSRDAERSATPTAGRRYARAALVAIGVLLLGLPLGNYWYTSWKVGHLNKKLRTFSAQSESQLKAFAHEQRDKAMMVAVTGPGAFQVSAVNEYLIETKNLNERNIPAKLSLRVRDESTKNRPVLLEKIGVESEGTYRLAIPPDLGFQLEAPARGNPRELSLEVTAEGQAANQHARLTEKLSLIGAAYITHLTTDKPMYKPGEVVGFRSLTLDSFSRKPAEEDLRLIFTVTNPNGQEIFKQEGPALLAKRAGAEKLLEGPDGKPIRGVGAGEYAIPNDAPGGEYTLNVHEGLNRFAPQQRRFVINRYEKPRLHKELEFTRKSYGPGDEVLAACKVSKIEGGVPLADQPVTATVQVDGKHYRADGQEDPNAVIALRTDQDGAVSVRFTLPRQILKGEGRLSLRFSDGGNVETIVRSIPIVLKKLQVDFYPEGGDLIAGVLNRVYFQARTALDKPAELKGRIVDDKETQIIEIQTLSDDKQAGVNQGMGVCAFMPSAGRKYELKIDTPAGIEGKYPLPEVKEDGVALSVPASGTSDRPGSESIHARAWSAKRDRELLIGVFYHGRLLSHETKTVKAGEKAEWNLQVAGPGGVYRVTAFEVVNGSDEKSKMVPVAERLIYRGPDHRLDLAVKSDKEVYVPGEKVQLSLSAADETGKPAPAILLIGVVDQGVLSLADEKTYHSMPAHFYLTSEIKHPEDLEHADVLLSDSPQSAAHLDLLLGTQGWRRFAEIQPRLFQDQEPQESGRLLASVGQIPVRTSNGIEVENEFLPELKKRLSAKTKELQEEKWQVEEERTQAKASLATYEEIGQSLGILFLGLLFAGITVGAVILAVRFSERVTGPQLVTGGAVLISCLLLGMCLLFPPGCGDLREAPSKDKATFSVAKTRSGGVASRASPMEKGVEDRLEKADLEPRARNEETGGAMAQMSSKNAKSIKSITDGTSNTIMVGETFREPGKSQGGKDEIELSPEDAGTVAYADNRAELAMRFHGDRETLLASKPLSSPHGRQFSTSKSAEIEDAVPLVVREYAHRKADLKGHLRSDFTETVYWNPVLVLSDGQDSCNFDLSDSVTSYQVRALGHTLDGRLGEMTTFIRARKPFSVEPKIPVEITNNDKIDLPITVANDTAGARDVHVRLQTKYLDLAGAQSEENLHLESNQRKRLVYRLQPTAVEGEASLHVAGECEPFAADRVLRTIKIVPEGFPMTGSSSAVLDQVVRHDLRLPQTWVKGTLKLQVQAFPSLLADLQTGLEAMLQEPHGCFEQTSSSNYPNLLILDYLRENNLAKPQLTKRVQQLLASGYQRLISFECTNTAKNRREGYEWFGGTVPPHEALTAYGLLEFRDMNRVFDVDKAMVERTHNFLMNQRDGKGGFKRNNGRWFHQFGHAPEEVVNAYIVWALTENSKEDDLSQELAVLSEQAKTSKDSYFVALVANSLLNREKKDECAELLKTLAAMQDKDGFIGGAHGSITDSRGRDLQIETTSLAVLAWIKANPPKRMERFRTNLQSAVKWLGQQRGPVGGFGATQATVLALKALTALSQTTKTQAGELILHVGNQEVVRRKFPAGVQEVLTLELPDPDRHLRAGTNKLRIESIGDNEFPYTLSWSYRTLTPPSSEKCAVGLTTRLEKIAAKEGETVRLSAVVQNKEDQGQGMAVAIIGLPAGLTLPEDMKQLKDLARLRNDETEPGIISAWEIRGRELILYWRELAPKQKTEVNLDLICRVPGEYQGPASRAYLYYDADEKCWVEPLKVVIQPGE